MEEFRRSKSRDAEELIGVLAAISVVSKRLARKLIQLSKRQAEDSSEFLSSLRMAGWKDEKGAKDDD